MRLMRDEMREMMKELKELKDMKGWKEEIKAMRREIKEEVRGGIKKQLKKEIEGLKKELREREERWKKEREELQRRVGVLEEKEREGQEMGRVEERLREMERKIEARKREERRRNVVIKGLKSGVETIEKEVKKLMEEIGVVGELDEIRRIGVGEEGERGVIVARTHSLKQKKQVMSKRRNLKDRGIRIEDDLTWKKRKMRWSLREIARQERMKGGRVWVGYGKIQIEGVWWRWDEEEKILRDRQGKIWRGQGEVKG